MPLKKTRVMIMQCVTTPRDVICARAKRDFTEVEKRALVTEIYICLLNSYFHDNTSQHYVS